jgi:hypothetical protein
VNLKENPLLESQHQGFGRTALMNPNSPAHFSLANPSPGRNSILLNRPQSKPLMKMMNPPAKSPGRSTSAGLCLLALTLGAASLCAELLVHEPFAYERRQGYVSTTIRGEGIDGLNGGLGFAGGWWRIIPTNPDQDLFAGIPEGPDDYAPNDGWGLVPGVRTAPLSYTDANNNRLLASGNQIRTAFVLRSWNRRDLAETIGDPGTTVWLSFMAQANGLAGSSRYAFVELASWGGTGRIWIGNVTPVSNGNWGMQLPDRSTGAFSRDLGHPMDVPTMFLARIHFPDWENTNISIWLNPPDLTDEETLPAPIVQVDTDFTYLTLLGVAGRFSTDFDEIRIGTTYDSVTPSEFVPPVVEAPQLAIARDGANVAVSWPAAAAGFTLYSSEDLVLWTPVSEEPVVEDERNIVNVATETDRLFFRLQQ